MTDLVSIVTSKKSLPKPNWLKVPLPSGSHYLLLKERLRSMGLHTVCEEARCPNIGECWETGTATLMLLGDTCTRHCRFCAVKSGNPRGVLDPDEPEKAADITALMQLKYVVLTSVDRDDLPDNGADHFRKTVQAIKRKSPEMIVETLTGDFAGEESAIAWMVDSGLDVFAHNIETVSRLQRTVRDARASYAQSLRVLQVAKQCRPKILTKSSIMLGLGETEAEVLETMEDLRKSKVSILTLGQYLRPTEKHLPVQEYITPEKFNDLKEKAKQIGFDYVASGPLVRSSYKAAELFIHKQILAANHSTNTNRV